MFSITDENDQNAINICEVKATDQTGHKQSQLRRSKGAKTTSKTSTDSETTKPSFPTKKRIQVPQCATSEAQIDPEMQGGSGEVDRKNSERCPVSQKDMFYTFENGELVFSPFFWLRDEEDLQKSSQKTDENELMYTPQDAPRFSDIKDSDDEDISKRNSDVSSNIN